MWYRDSIACWEWGSGTKVLGLSLEILGLSAWLLGLGFRIVESPGCFTVQDYRFQGLELGGKAGIGTLLEVKGNLGKNCKGRGGGVN